MDQENEKFDYNKAVEELESIAKLVEDPSTGIDDIDRYIKRSEELITACRAYLRSAGEKISALDAGGAQTPTTEGNADGYASDDDDDMPF